MKTIGFMISKKKNEKRRALLPSDIEHIRNKEYLYFEENYGVALGIPDEEYIKSGANMDSRENILTKDIICDPKIGDATYLDQLKKNQILFGWIHAVQNKELTDFLVENELTAFAWEDMFEGSRHVFWRNNELAGEAAILHAFTLYGKLPSECKVAILGRGNIARGALKILGSLGAEITVYDKRTENLLNSELSNFDVIVNGVLWDIYRKDHVINKSDLKRMKPESMIIDISCDESGAIETSKPTTISDPIYVIDGVIHYVVDHTPTIVYKSVSKSLSKEVCKYIDDFIEDKEKQNKVLYDSLIIEKGKIKDRRINDYQQRK